MFPTDELTPQQEAILKAEEEICDDMLGSLEIFTEEELREDLAALMEIGLYCKQEKKLEQFETKCLLLHDYMARRKAGV